MYKHYLTWYATLFFVSFQPHLFRPQWQRTELRTWEKKPKSRKKESISKRSPFRHYEGADSSPTPHSDSVQDLWQMALYSHYCWFAAMKKHNCFVFTKSWKSFSSLTFFSTVIYCSCTELRFRGWIVVMKWILP